MNPDHIPDLYWNLANTYHTRSIGHADTQNTIVSAHIDVRLLVVLEEIVVEIGAV